MNIEMLMDFSLDVGYFGFDYVCCNLLEIGVQLCNLVNCGDFLIVQYLGGQFVMCLFEVDVGVWMFMFDWGVLFEQNVGIFGVLYCMFVVLLEGVCVEFIMGMLCEMCYEGLFVFVVDFFDVLVCIQCCEYFCVDVLIVDLFLCCGKLLDGESFLFEVYNLLFGGVGLCMVDECVEVFEVGMLLLDVEFELIGYGKLLFDL